jgi:hypothetical protein
VTPDQTIDRVRIELQIVGYLLGSHNIAHILVPPLQIYYRM